MKTLKLAIATGLLTVSLMTAQAVTFKIGAGSQAQQIAQVESVTDFETFTGRTDKVSGSINFDPAKRTGSGKIVIDAASLSTGIDLRDEHMRSEMWLDTAKYKTITFETTKVKFLKGNTYSVAGKLTMHGVTKSITTNVDVKHIKESASTKSAGFKGDVLQVKTKFNIKLSDFGVKIPAPAQKKVANTVTISLTTYGQSGS
jgi:polyisoprenoid-binding protein YceI